MHAGEARGRIDPSRIDGIRDPRPRIPDWLRDIVVAAVVIGLSFAADPRQEYVPPGPVAIGAAILAAALLPLRRRWPIPLVGVAVALYAAVALFEHALSTGLEIAIAIAVFGVSNRRELRTGVTVTILAIVAGLLATFLVTGTLLDPRVPQLIFVIAFCGAAGDATRMHRGYIAAITERAVRAEQTRESEARRRVTEERLRIARDLHDAVAHEISVISLNAGVASQTIDVDPEQARESLATVRSAARTVLGEIGDLLELLRAAEETGAEEADPEAAVAAPQPSLDRLDRLVARFGEAGLAVSVRVEGDLGRVSPAAGRVAYRVIQESLTNAYKHGAERRAHVLLEVRERSLEVVVTNPVAGAPSASATVVASSPADAEGRAGFGMAGLREQVASVRGAVETGLGPGGWRVVASLPLAPQPPSPASEAEEGGRA